MKAFLYTTASLVALLTSGALVHGWSSSTFFGVVTDDIGNVLTTPVVPTAAFTATSSSVDVLSTVFVVDGSMFVTVPLTLSYLYLPPNAPIYTGDVPGGPPSPTPASSIGTVYYGPAVLSNPASCTLTKFTYTTTHTVSIPSDLAAQATESVNAALITSRTGVYSTDLGGQQLSTVSSTVYLSSQVLGGPLPPDNDEQSYLDQCVDPRHYLCTKGITYGLPGVGSTGGCWFPTTSYHYPPQMTTSSSGPTKTGNGAVGCYSPGMVNMLLVLFAVLHASL